MLKQYIFDQIDVFEIITEFDTSVALIDCYQKESKLKDIYYTEAGILENIGKIGNTIKKAFSAIADFFKKLFNRHKTIDGDLDEISNTMTEAMEAGMTAEDITASSKLPPEKKEDLLEFVAIWMADPSKKPSVLSKEAFNEMKQLTNDFKKLKMLTTGTVKILIAQGDNVMKSIETHAKAMSTALKNQEEKSMPGEDKKKKNAKKFFAKNGTNLKDSEKIIGMFCNELNDLQKAIAEAMDNPDKQKAFESFTNVSSILRESMEAGKLIQQRLNQLNYMTPELKESLKRSTVLKFKAKFAGKNIPGSHGRKQFEAVNLNGKSEIAKYGKNMASSFANNVIKNDLSSIGEEKAKKYASAAENMAKKRYQRDIVDTINEKNKES